MSNGPRTVKILHHDLIRPAARISRHATFAKRWRAHRPRPSPWRGIKDQVMGNTKFELGQPPASVRGREQLAFVPPPIIDGGGRPGPLGGTTSRSRDRSSNEHVEPDRECPATDVPLGRRDLPRQHSRPSVHPAFRVRTGEGRRRADVAYGGQRGGTHHIDQRVSGGKWVTCCWMMCLR